MEVLGGEHEKASTKSIKNWISKDDNLYVPDYFPKAYKEPKKETEIE